MLSRGCLCALVSSEVASLAPVLAPSGAAPLRGCTTALHACEMRQQVLSMPHAQAGGLKRVATDPLLPAAA